MKFIPNVLLLLCVICCVLESSQIYAVPQPQKITTAEPDATRIVKFPSISTTTAETMESTEATTTWLRNGTLKGCTKAGGTIVTSSVTYYAIGMCFTSLIVPFLLK